MANPNYHYTIQLDHVDENGTTIKQTIEMHGPHGFNLASLKPNMIGTLEHMEPNPNDALEVRVKLTLRDNS
jgi:hypothetical protein